MKTYMRLFFYYRSLGWGWIASNRAAKRHGRRHGWAG